MLTLANIEKHKGLYFSEDIKSICRPLVELNNINFFHYFKINTNNTCISLSTHPHWVKTRFQLFQQGSLHDIQKNAAQNFQLWDLIYPVRTEVFAHARKYFDIHHGITITRKRPDNSYELFHFATSNYNPSMNQFYIDNIHLLEHFIHYFQEKAHRIIQEAELDKIYHNSIKSYYINNINSRYYENNFLQKTPINKYYLSLPNGQVSITPHELKIIKSFTNGFSAKEIAKYFSTSYRTVQTQIANLKYKLACQSKMELRSVLNKSLIKGDKG